MFDELKEAKYFQECYNVKGSRTIATKENCLPTLKLTLNLTQTLTLTGGNFPDTNVVLGWGNFPRGQLSGYQ